MNTLRVEESKTYLSKSRLSITEIAYVVGFKDGNYYSKVFSDNYHSSPKQYRKGGHDAINQQ